MSNPAVPPTLQDSETSDAESFRKVKGTPTSVEEARREMIATTVDYASDGPDGPKAYFHHVEGAADALIAAVRSSTLREVRYAVLFEIVGEATDGDRLLRESDILAGLAKMEGK